MPIAGAAAAVTTTLIALLAGCLAVEGVPCGDRVCAPGAACDELRGVCLTRDQVLACEGKADTDPCAIGGAEGSCQDGACFVPFCGDHIRNGAEECEDTDLGGADCQTLGFYDAAGLACTSHCTYETAACAGFCGDRIANDVETCDGQIAATDSCLEFGFDAGALACRSSCVPDVSRCEPGIDYTIEALPGGEDLEAVWSTGPDNVYVVGANTVMHWDGTAWTDLAPPSALGIPRAVWGIGSDVFVVGGVNRLPAGTGQGMLLRWNGSTWTQMTSPVNEALVGVWGSSASNVFAVGYNGAAIRFNGTSWSTTNSKTTVHLRGIWGSSATDIWAVGVGGAVDHWTGTQWTLTTIGAEDLNAISGSGPNEVFAVGSNGAILRFKNNAWTIQPTFTTTSLQGVSTLTTGDFIAIGLGEIYRFNNGTVDTIIPAANNLSSVWASGLDNIYVVGDDGAVIRMRNSAWSRMASGTETFQALWGSSPTDVVAVGFAGAVLRWNGVQWTPETCSSGILNAVWGSSANNVIAVGSSGTICTWTGTWSSSNAGASYQLNGVWGSSATDVYAVGHDTTPSGGGVILHRTASTWTPDASGGMLAYAYAVWGSGANDVYVVGGDAGTGGAIVHWDGTTWSRVTTAWVPYAVWGSGPRDVVVAGTNGKIAHWNGSAWAERSFGTYTFDAVWGTGPSNVYVAGSGAIAHWNGSSWSPMKSNTATDLRSLWGTSTGRDLYGLGGDTIMRRVRACSSAESSCDDGEDEDCDGLIDCADPDCGSSCGSGGACAGFATLACNTSVSATTAGGATSIDANGCDNWGRTGRERVYRVQPATGGTVTATLSGLTRDVDLVVLGEAATGGCDPFSGCTAASAQSGSADETVSFGAQANESYYLVVDGFGGTSSSFTLSVACP